MVGKVFLAHPEDIDIPLYENMRIIDGDDQVIYNKTANPSNLMVEALSENNPLAFGKTYFKLPDCTDIIDHIANNIDNFI